MSRSKGFPAVRKRAVRIVFDNTQWSPRQRFSHSPMSWPCNAVYACIYDNGVLVDTAAARLDAVRTVASASTAMPSSKGRQEHPSERCRCPAETIVTLRDVIGDPDEHRATVCWWQAKVAATFLSDVIISNANNILATVRGGSDVSLNDSSHSRDQERWRTEVAATSALARDPDVTVIRAVESR